MGREIAKKILRAGTDVLVIVAGRTIHGQTGFPAGKQALIKWNGRLSFLLCFWYLNR